MASLFEDDGKTPNALNGYDIEVEEKVGPGATCTHVTVRCTNGGAIRAAAVIEAGKPTHVAIEPSQYGGEAMQVLAVVLETLPS